MNLTTQIARLNKGGTVILLLTTLASCTALSLQKTETNSNEIANSVQPSAPPIVQPGVYDWDNSHNGELANGMRFAILPRESNEPGYAIHMRVEGGFIAEERPGERGLVHLIEHLAFQGSTNLPQGGMIKVGLPLTFPAPSAGATDWQSSTYYLSSRTNDMSGLDTLLFLYREIASELVFTPEAVEQQREDVLREMEEKRYGNQIYADYVAAIAPGSPNDIIEAQNSDDVADASTDTIRSLYHQIYRPKSTIVTIVGNVDPIVAGEMIRKRFGGWVPVGKPNAPVPAPRILFNKMKPFSVASEADGRRGVTLSVTMSAPDRNISREEQIQTAILDKVITHAVKARILTRNPDIAQKKMRVSVENGEHGFRQIMMLFLAEEEEWPSAVAILKSTSCSLYASGWTAQEWDNAKTATFNDLAYDAQNMSATRNIDLAGMLAEARAKGNQLLSPKEMQTYAANWLPRMGSTEAHEWWRQQWGGGMEHLRVEAPELSKTESLGSLVQAALARNACAD